MIVNKLFIKYKYLIITIFSFSFVIFFIINKKDDWYGLEDKEITYLDSLYYTFVTFSTIGYGDITPKSVRAKIITMLIIIGLILNIYIQVKN